MKFNYNDGGRSKYFKGEANDCVCRAVAIASGKDYKEIYDRINELAKKERITKNRKTRSSARDGVYKVTSSKLLKELGFKFVATMGIGTGCKVHLKADELPKGTIICKVSTHLVAVIDGVINDTYDCSRDETRCVYGYWIKE
jgi:hypothetical protein